jgi:hypothetical protein
VDATEGRRRASTPLPLWPADDNHLERGSPQAAPPRRQIDRIVADYERER